MERYSYHLNTIKSTASGVYISTRYHYTGGSNRLTSELLRYIFTRTGLASKATMPRVVHQGKRSTDSPYSTLAR